MRTRLNVTEAERLRYSYRRLRALSALRNAGLEPSYTLYKEHLLPSTPASGGAGAPRLPTSGRLGYRVELPDGSDCYCERLVDVEALAADYQLWKRTQARRYAIRVGFPVWQRDPKQRRVVLITAGLWEEQAQHVAAPAYKATYVPLKSAPCSWPNCAYPANGVIDGQAMCAAHAMVYGQMRLASDPPRLGRR